jgi:hypothetical protein
MYSGAAADNNFKTQVQPGLGRYFAPDQGQEHLRCGVTYLSAWRAHRGERGQHLVTARQVIKSGHSQALWHRNA